MSVKLTKEQLFLWAVGLLRNKVDEEKYGSFTVIIEKGKTQAVKFEERIHPPLDETQKTG